MKTVGVDRFARKAEEAERVIKACIGKKGVWASPARYRYQCWTRDLVISMRTLMRLGYGDIVERHLWNAMKKRRSDYPAPILFADGRVKLFLRKALEAAKKRRISYVLRKMVGPGLELLTPGTRDVFPLLIIGICEWESVKEGLTFRDCYMIDLQTKYTVDFIDRKLLRNGFLVGADWRDMLEEDLQDKILLGNNALLYRMYELYGGAATAKAFKDKINGAFWNDRYYVDSLGGNDFDVFGQSLAVIFGIVPPERYASILDQYRKMDTRFGFRINDILPKAVTGEERARLEKIQSTTNQYHVIWPFVNGFAILAMLKMGRADWAMEKFCEWTDMDGFYEWYDPDTGRGCGSADQLWSAAMYLEVRDALRKRQLIN